VGGHGLRLGETGYSGVTFPLVEPCLEHVAKLGYRRVIVFPYFLFTGILVQRIYGFTDEVAAKHPEIEFVKAGYLNDHPQVLDTIAERVLEQSCADPELRDCGTATQVLASKAAAPPTSRQRSAARAPAFGAVPPPTCVLCKYRTAVLGFEA
jgi:sirohydrochlorin cobaltochelatase